MNLSCINKHKFLNTCDKIYICPKLITHKSWIITNKGAHIISGNTKRTAESLPSSKPGEERKMEYQWG